MGTSEHKPSSDDDANEAVNPPGQASPGAAGSDGDGDPLREIADYGAQLVAYAEYFARAQADSVRLAVRDARRRFMWSIGSAAVAVGFVVTAIVYVFDGLAGGLAVVFGGQPWLASLVTGGVALLAFGAGAWIVVRYAGAAAYRKRVQEYEAIKERQRARYGHDAGELDRAARRETVCAAADADRAGRHRARPDGPPARPAEDD